MTQRKVVVFAVAPRRCMLCQPSVPWPPWLYLLSSPTASNCAPSTLASSLSFKGAGHVCSSFPLCVEYSENCLCSLFKCPPSTNLIGLFKMEPGTLIPPTLLSPPLPYSWPHPSPSKLLIDFFGLSPLGNASFIRQASVPRRMVGIY